ncbi:molybdopterin oxidoreductase, partial [Escherichia coli]|uniref:hypothetical protein n=1 Tax=Escherichia coli TaxID=562 RepID=UPI000FA01936
TPQEVLAFLTRADEGTDALGLLKAQWRREGEDDTAFEARFSEALRLGFFADSAPTAEDVRVTGTAPEAKAAAPASGIEVVFRPDGTLYDGTHADLAWLQELPKPLTKVVWENVVALSPALAAREG